MTEHILTTSYFNERIFKTENFSFLTVAKMNSSETMEMCKSHQKLTPQKITSLQKSVLAKQSNIFDYVQDLLTAWAYICAMSTNVGLKY